MNDEQPTITSPAHEEVAVDAMDVDDGVGAITPSTVSSSVLPQWSQLMPDVQARKRIGTTPVSSSSSSSSDSDEQDDDDDDVPSTPWQSMNDLPERRVMVQRIITLTEKKNAVAAAQQQGQSAATLAKRIELSLYSRAHSLDEYRNLATLRRRLQSLVALSYHEAAAERAMQEQQQVLSPKRRLLLARHLDLTPDFNIKRRRVVGLSDVEETKTNSSSGERGFLFQRIGDDCVRNIFSFLDGREVIANRVLSRFASEFLPSCILRLQLSAQQLQHCLDSDDLFSLYRLSNLEQLVITNSSSSPQNPEQQRQHGAAGPLHAWGCAELDATQSNDGEYIVARLAAALDAGAGRHLKQLHLVSVFTNTRQCNGVRALCDALTRGACPQLEDLLLGGNSITDVGISHIARLLKVRDAVPRLSRLDLRRNYIGEAGLYKIVSALARANTTQLRYLCLGGNVITDNCVPPLQELLLAGRACPQLRFLGLEDNFLSPDGVQTIIQAAASSGMVPKLHRVCSSDDGAIL
ncbi:hypothetical protein FI667_g504, partial [Globisporangium splendens]